LAAFAACLGATAISHTGAMNNIEEICLYAGDA